MNNFNKAGYIPIIGTAVGVIRIAGGTIESAIAAIIIIGCIAIGEFSDAKKYSTKTGEGLDHVIRGLVELVPIFGGNCTRKADKTKNISSLEENIELLDYMNYLVK
jgi:hypothetical protein